MNTTCAVVGSNPVQAWIFFSDLIFTTAQVVFITVKITFIFTFLSAVQIYDFHIFTVVYSLLYRFIWNQHNEQLPIGLLAQLVECCNGTTEVMGSNPVQAWIFFRPYFHYCSNSVRYCEDRFHTHITRIVRQTLRRIANEIFGDIGTREFHMAINWTERWGPFKYPAHLPSEVIYCDNTVSCLIQFIKCFINNIFPGFTHWWLKNYESKA